MKNPLENYCSANCASLMNEQVWTQVEIRYDFPVGELIIVCRYGSAT